MKVYITRDWADKTYEVWETKPVNWSDAYSDYQGNSKSKIIISMITVKEAKKLFNLRRHLKKKEVDKIQHSKKSNAKRFGRERSA